MTEKKNKRRDPFARSDFEGKDPLDLIPVAKKAQRDRTWEKKNKAYSYRIPARLTEEAIEVRESILSIAAFNEYGEQRMDRTTADDVAKNLLDFALKQAQKENLTFQPTRAGKMKLQWEEVEQSWDSPIILKKIPPKKNKQKAKQIVVSYRWGQEFHAQIEGLAGAVREVEYREDGNIKNDPHRFSVSPGEVVVRLLQRALKVYINRKMRLTSHPKTVAQKVTGWASE